MDLRVFVTQCALLFALLLLAACSTATPVTPQVPQAPHEFSGILVGETRWQGEVILADDVIIPRGSRLVIAPGTRITVRPSLSTKIEPEQLSAATELLIRGRLEALGSDTQPIEFVIEGGLDDDIAWAGIIAEQAEFVSLAHVRLPAAEQGVWLVATPGMIHDCLVRGSRYGMVFQKPAELTVSGNRIEAGEAGLFCWLGANPKLLHNQVVGLVEEGLFIDATSHPTLRGNRITGNGIGLVAPPLLETSGNRISGNRVERIELGGQL
ncbi:MAG: hypothetical protein C0624_05735 [Desulfuromonas sp.]|nr:MAG: hypothetical protein C0624_05735 [Desulfuromonas sp.]